MRNVVLVTGSSGLIGYRVCEELIKECTVVGLDREGRPFPPESVHWVFADLGSGESMQQAMEFIKIEFGSRLSSVFHFGAYYDFSGEPSLKYDEVTLRGTERLLRELRRFECEQFVFSSSMLVHKPVKPGSVINEDSPIGATWDYPESKVKTEELIKQAEKSFPVVIMRIAGVYDESCHSIPLAHQISRIYEQRLTSYLYPGNLESGQAFVHIQDAVAACVNAYKLRKELPEELTVLIGEEDVVSYRDIQEIVSERMFGEPIATAKVAKSFAKFGAWLQDSLAGDSFIKPWMIDRSDDHYAIDTTRARQVLDWYPTHRLRSTLPTMVDKLLEDPAYWYKENGLEMPFWESRKSA